MSIRASALAVTVALVAACGGKSPPVPVLGSGTDIPDLVGEWTGEYSSTESGRSGSIYFRLEAGADSAAGDILMIPEDRPHDHPGGVHPPSEYLSITFVGISNGRVRGMLEPYVDPGCGCRLDTRFEGRLRADTIRGTYTSRHIEGGLVQSGQWFAFRTRSSL